MGLGTSRSENQSEGGAEQAHRSDDYPGKDQDGFGDRVHLSLGAGRSSQPTVQCRWSEIADLNRERL